MKKPTHRQAHTMVYQEKGKGLARHRRRRTNLHHEQISHWRLFTGCVFWLFGMMPLLEVPTLKIIQSFSAGRFTIFDQNVNNVLYKCR